MKNQNQKIVLATICLIIGLYAGSEISYQAGTKPWKDLAMKTFQKYDDSLSQLLESKGETNEALRQAIHWVEEANLALTEAIDSRLQMQAQEKLIEYLVDKISPALRFNARLKINYNKSQFSLGEPIMLFSTQGSRCRYDKNGYVVPTPRVKREMDRALFISYEKNEVRVWHLGLQKMLTFEPTKVMTRQGLIVYMP